MLAKRSMLSGLHLHRRYPFFFRRTGDYPHIHPTRKVEVRFLSSIVHTQKLPVPPDPIFSAAFYAPYEAAANACLSLLCAARETMAPDVLALSYRLKSGPSIRGKLLRKGLTQTAAAAGAALHDIAGLRVVLSTREAVYRFADLLLTNKLLFLDDIHDYIAAPKPSGYRSLHLIVRIPVFLHGRHCLIPVEIQLRTAVMDAWACAEHKLIYKPCI